MPGVSQEQIAQAKKIDLLTYLQTCEPNELVCSGPNEYRTASHHSLVISNGLWHWVNGNIGGKTALKYLTRVKGYSFVDAVTTLCGTCATQNIIFQPIKNHTKIEKPPFILPPRNDNNDRIIAYLRNRGIADSIITDCIERGDLYESAKTRNCVFVGRDKQGNPSYACIRGTFSNYKQDVAGSSKQYGFCYSPTADSRIVNAYESPVDALSAATIAAVNAEQCESRHYLSLGGTSPVALLRFLKDRPEINQVILSLDNDQAGRNGTRKIMEAIRNNTVLASQVTEITDNPPDYGKDYNEQLQHFIGEQKSITAPSRHKQAAFSL